MSIRIIVLLGVFVSMPLAAEPQEMERQGTFRIVVHDPADLPIQGAEVTLTASDAGTITAATDDRGEARFESIRPGVYSGRVTSPGFEHFDVGQFSIRAGTRVARQVTLQIRRLAEEINVAPPAADPLMDSFARQLTPEQVAALPEDPEELARVLQQMVGPDADIWVDGFSGGRLPRGARIQSVRVRYDVGAASNTPGPRIEIRTTPGGDRWRNTADTTVQDEALSARDFLSHQQPAGQTWRYSWNLVGPVARGRTGLAIGIDGSRSLENQSIRAAVPGGIYSRLIDQPGNEIGFWTRIDHQVTDTQTIQVNLARDVSNAHNQGIGRFDLPERAFSRDASNAELQVGHHSTVGSRVVSDLRFTLGWGSNELSSVSDARTIQVLDAFTSGGAQQRGRQQYRNFGVQNDLEFTVRQKHQITVGLSIDGAHYRGDQHANASGTYQFSSLASLEAGQATTFIQRVGDPTYAYSMNHFGWHIQDDYRVGRKILLNLGLRHDFQTHLRDWENFAPRLGVSWSPSSKARTTLRASMGIFHVPLEAGMYQQLLLVDGVRQHDLVISNPGYPDPFSEGQRLEAVPPSIIRARPDVVMPFTTRYTVGLDQPINKLVRLRATWSRQTGHNLFRSRNANPPVDGVRPNPSIANITELETTARSLNESLQTELLVNFPPRRLSANLNYVLGRAMNETDWAFSLPPDSFDLSGEWGPARGDVRHRVNVGVNTDLPGAFRVNASFRAQSASRYNITTGADPNGDGLQNERPAGVTRNSARGASTKNMDVTLTWRLNLGHRQTADAPGASSPRPPASDDELFRFEVFARATNVLNLANPLGFSGVQTSPFFGLPTSVGSARRVLVGTRVWF
jgi:hypothetical protein